MASFFDTIQLMNSEIILAAFFLFLLAAVVVLAIIDEKKMGDHSVFFFLTILLALPLLGLAAAMTLSGNVIPGAALAACSGIATFVALSRKWATLFPPLALLSSFIILAIGFLGI